jgi:hypothetical protein
MNKNTKRKYSKGKHSKGKHKKTMKKGSGLMDYFKKKPNDSSTKINDNNMNTIEETKDSSVKIDDNMNSVEEPKNMVLFIVV